jgi:UDP-glucuronate decarboxylase
MKILITGGAGFIGSNLVEKLLADNQIYVVDNLSTGTYENLKEFENNENFKFYNMDITNNKIISFIRENSFDIIYNFACPASPQYYLEFPIETWESSVLGVRNLLKAIEGTKVKLFHSSTSEVYGDALENPQTEDYWGNVNSIGVRACYDEGKRAAEALILEKVANRSGIIGVQKQSIKTNINCNHIINEKNQRSYNGRIETFSDKLKNIPWS